MNIKEYLTDNVILLINLNIKKFQKFEYYDIMYNIQYIKKEKNLLIIQNIINNRQYVYTIINLNSFDIKSYLLSYKYKLKRFISFNINIQKYISNIYYYNNNITIYYNNNKYIDKYNYSYINICVFKNNTKYVKKYKNNKLIKIIYLNSLIINNYFYKNYKIYIKFYIKNYHNIFIFSNSINIII